VHSSRMRENAFDISEINAKSDGASAVLGSFLSKSDEPLASSSGIRRRPNLRSRKVRLASFERPIRFPTP
jgi:hypothetical protein